MKANAGHPRSPCEKLWLWIPASMTSALLIYLAGAIATRVMFERGKLPQGSWRYRAAVFIYQPLETVTASNLKFWSAFNACVHVFIPEKKDDNQ